MDFVVKQVLEKSGFSKLNPVQEEAIKAGVLEGESLVLAAPTASGKTLVAEFAALNAIKKGRKVVYIVPLRALASEKYHEFKEKYEPLGIRIALSIGDLDSSDHWLARFDLIIVTSEKFDSLLRHGIPWIDQIGLVVADEIHLLNDPGRGPTLEVTLTKLKSMINPQILALSATIKNYKEIAEWLGAKAVRSDYRPVKLYKGVCFDREIHYQPKKDKKELGSEYPPDFEIAKDTLRKKKQALIFVSTRRNTESLAGNLGRMVKERLETSERAKLKKISESVLGSVERPTLQCEKLSNQVLNGVAFHHAGLTNKQRKTIEDGFKEGAIKVISATPTLAWGVNLPAYRVVVRDLKRFSRGYGSDYIPVLEIQQMCVPYSSKILMKNGTFKKIGDLIEKDDNELFSTEINTSTFRVNKVVKKFQRESDEFVKIKVSGNELIATPEHPVLALRENKPLWVKISEIKKGDRVAIISDIKIDAERLRFLDLLDDKIYVRGVQQITRNLLKKSGLKYSDAARELNIPHKTIKAYCYNKAIPLPLIKSISRLANCTYDELSEFLSYKNFKTRSGKRIILPQHLDEDFAWFLGLFAAEGSIVSYVGKEGKWKGTKYVKMKLYNTESKIIHRVEKIMKELGVSYYKTMRRGGFSPRTGTILEITNQTLASILFNLGFTSGSKSYNINAKKIYNFSDSLISSYLAGIFDGDGSFDSKTKSVRLGSRSKDLIDDCKNLLLRLGIHSTIHAEKKFYVLAIYRKSDVNKFLKIVPTLRFKKESIKYVVNTRPVIKKGNLNFEKVKCTELVKKRTPVPVYNLSVERDENFVCNGFIVHNCGRAGRPKYDSEGEAILIAKSKGEAEYVFDTYVNGEPEEIKSKLGVEPVIRMHSLALIASGITFSKESLLEFFSKTFYAHQYGDLSVLRNKLEDVIEMLKDFGFVKSDKKSDSENPFRSASDLASDEKLEATLIGKRVSELYIDPVTANYLIKNLGKSDKSIHPFALLQLISNTLEMRPALSLRKNDFERINEVIAENEKLLLEKPPNPWDIEYEDYTRSIKTAWFFSEWMEEMGEDLILEKFGVTPGELHVRLSNADWLLYATQELTLLLGLKDLLKHIRKTRLRVKYGIREELLPLVRLKGIGRARARTLHNSRLRKLSDLRKVPLESLSRLIGPKLARSVKEQLNELKESA